MNRRYAIILAALVLAMCGAIFATIIGKRCLMRHRMATRPVMRPSNGPPFERLPTYPSQGPAPSWPGHAYGPPPPPPGQNPYYYPPAPGPPQEQQVQYQYPYPYPLQHGIVLQQQPVGAPAPAPGAPTAPGDAAHTPAPAQAYQPPAPRELI